MGSSVTVREYGGRATTCSLEPSTGWCHLMRVFSRSGSSLVPLRVWARTLRLEKVVIAPAWRLDRVLFWTSALDACPALQTTCTAGPHPLTLPVARPLVGCLSAVCLGLRFRVGVPALRYPKFASERCLVRNRCSHYSRLLSET